MNWLFMRIDIIHMTAQKVGSDWEHLSPVGHMITTIEDASFAVK